MNHSKATDYSIPIRGEVYDTKRFLSLVMAKERGLVILLFFVEFWSLFSSYSVSCLLKYLKNPKTLEIEITQRPHTPPQRCIQIGLGEDGPWGVTGHSFPRDLPITYSDKLSNFPWRPFLSYFFENKTHPVCISI